MLASGFNWKLWQYKRFYNQIKYLFGLACLQVYF